MTRTPSSDPPAAKLIPRRDADALDLSESVAGEEDPGASLDIPAAAPPPKPGDEAPSGSPGSGEDVCPACGGSGRVEGRECPDCRGTGKVNTGIGGG